MRESARQKLEAARLRFQCKIPSHPHCRSAVRYMMPSSPTGKAFGDELQKATSALTIKLLNDMNAKLYGPGK